MLSCDTRHLSNNFDRNMILCQILLKSVSLYDSFYFLIFIMYHRINEIDSAPLDDCLQQEKSTEIKMKIF